MPLQERRPRIEIHLDTRAVRGLQPVLPLPTGTHPMLRARKVPRLALLPRIAINPQ